jgi:acetylornithine deacetylase/succinyl-diaminopimelate desuccinylase-like protein
MFDTYKLPRKELIEFCQALVRTPSVNGIHNEKQIADLIAQFALSHDLEVDVLALEPERPCVLVKVGPNAPSGLLLVAHTDTVPVGNEDDWNYPPFGAEIVNGRLYGRGAADNKGGIVAAISALLLLKANTDVRLKQPVLLVCVPDEESGASGRLGIKYLNDLKKLSGLGAIYTYPGINQIQIGHRGVLRLRITTHGKSFHTGTSLWQNADKSFNAITGMAEILLELEKLRFDAKRDDDLFRRYKTVITPTLISGGVGQSVTPDYCEAMVDIRLVPSYERQEIEDSINAILKKVIKKRKHLKVDISTKVSIPHTIISRDSQIVSTVSEAVNEIIGEKPTLSVSGPANESYILNNLGIPTCLLGPNGQGVHAANEYIVIDSIFQAAAIYALTAIKLLDSSPDTS